MAHISGLDDFSLPHPMSVRKPLDQQAAVALGSGPGGAYVGSDMRAAYYGGTALDGNGQAIGLVEFGGYALSDVDLTFSAAGQSYKVPVNNVLLDGSTGATSPTYGDAEQTLDIVQAIGMAPNLSQVRVYIGAGSDDPAILNSMASENLAKQLSCSWGWRPADSSVDDVFFQEMAAQGQSFFASSGDDGAFDAAISPFFYPADDQFVTTVGGTHLTTTGAGGGWASETVWNSAGNGSGGGISPDGISIPSWQVGLATSANGGSTTLRNVPDVAMEGDFDNYACANGICNGDYAGTSFSAPRWAGFMALVNQQAVETGNAPSGGIGFINPALYRLAQGANTSADFHDITSGNNDTGNQPLWFSAVPGYDLTMGWGSANGQRLIDDLAGTQVPGFWIVSSQSTVGLNPGGTASTTLTITDAGGFGDGVTLAISALPSGVTASFSQNPATGSSVLTLTASASAPTASQNVTITGTSGTLTATTNITVAVHTASFTLSASPATVGINQGASGTTAITVLPLYGFKDAVNLAVSGLPSGVTASFSPASTTGASTLTLTASSTAVPNTSTLTVTGTCGALTATTKITLSIHGPSFTLSSYSSVNIGQGANGTASVYVNDQYGFTKNVNLAVSGLPAGVTASFSPNPTAGSSVLTFSATSSAAVGSSVVTVTGTSGQLVSTTTISLGVYAPTFTLSTSSSLSIGQGNSLTSYINVNGQYGFAGNVTLSVAGLPSGVTALWTPNPTTGTSTLILSASASAKTGQYPLTITGTSGSITQTTSTTLGVFTPSFTLTSYSSASIGQGGTGSAYVYINPQYGFNGSVNLSISGLPSGVTAAFSPNPATGSSNVTLTASSTAAVGQYTATITGTSGTLTQTATLTFGVFTPTFTLSNYGNITAGQGASSSGTVYVNQQYGFSGSVNLTVSGLPAGVTASFSPNPTTGLSTLTANVSSTAATGQYNLTITGTSGTLTQTTTMTLSIYKPSFTLSTYNSVSVGQATSASASVYVYGQNGFSGSVTMAVSGLPAGVTATFSPNPTTGTSTLTFNASSTAALGQYPIVITGTSGGTTSSVSLQLGIYVPSFTLTAYSTSAGQGSSASNYIYVMSQNGFAGAVALSVSGLPSGVTGSFATNPTNYSSNLLLNVGASAALGTSTVTVTGTSGSQTVSTTFTLTVVAQSFTLSSSYSLALNQGASGTASVFVYGQNGFNSNVTLSASGLPSGVTASFSPNPTTGNSTLTLTASAAATPGVATVTITGVSGALTAFIPLTLTINSPGFSITAAPVSLFLTPGSSRTSTVAAVPSFGFSGAVSYVASGLPSGVTASFSPNSTSGSTTLTLNAASTATPVSGIVTVTGTSGSLTATTTLVVTVRAATAATATTLALNAGGKAASSMSAATLITGTATVSAGSTVLTTGQVNLCDAVATLCDAGHLIASAQLTSAGVATFQFLPSAGSHSYKAVFAGITANASSASAVVNLSVTASQSTKTTITQSGSAGNYKLTATVTGQGPIAPSGNVSFLDVTAGNASLGSGTLGSGTATLSLGMAQSQNVGSQPQSVSTGDFNADGIPDLAVANQGSNTITILLGNGDGTFATAASLKAGSSPLTIVSGDFNRDGYADLAVLLSGSSINVFLGNGDGTFTPSTLSPPTGYSPAGMTMGDFNGDGLLDLAVINGGNGTLTIFLGNGDGSFTPFNLSPLVGNQPNGIVRGDFNGDGVQDLAIVNAYGSTITILLGAGDGSFSSTGTITTSGYATSMAVADLNGDGKLDLVAGNEYNSVLSVLLGNGDGTFTAAASPSVGSYPLSVGIADLNGDGNPDLIATNYYNSTLSVVLGNGDGTFGASMSVAAGTYPTSLAVGDWNVDGIKDILVANSGGSTLTVLTSQLTQKATASATGISPIGQGQHAADASYTGDTVFAGSTSSTTNLTAAAGAPTVTISLSASSITTAQALTVSVTVSGSGANPVPSGSVKLTSGSYTSGAMVLSNGSAAIAVPVGALAAGINALSVSYTPDAVGASSYTGATGTSSVNVKKATPSVTLTASPASITPKQPLTVTITVSGGNGAPVAGGSVMLTGSGYSSPATTLTGGSTAIVVPAGTFPVGTVSLSASYTPDATSARIYTGATGSGSAMVAASAPVITWAAPAAISYGTALSNTQLNATADVAGTWAYTPAAGAILPAGSQILRVTFSPADQVNYSTVTASVALTINQAVPVVTWAPPASIAYGTALGSSQLNATASVPGTFAYTPALGAVLPVGLQVLSASFTPTDAANYVQTSATTQLTVSQATPTITWTAPSAIVYGTPLGSAQLNASSPIAGAFSYSPGAGVVPAAGAQTLSVTFTPADTATYKVATSTVTLNVNKAALSLTAASAARLFGAANPTFTGTVLGAVNGDTFTETFSTTAVLSSVVGTYPVLPAVTGLNAANYNITATSGLLTISPASTATSLSLSNGNLTFSATVAPGTSGIPTGSVMFFAGQTPFGTGTLVNGVASYSAASFPAGDVNLTAQYSGDANFNQSASGSVPVLTVSMSSPSLTLGQAGTASDTLTLGLVPGYAGTLQLSCNNLPQNASCSFAPSSLVFSGSTNNAATVLTIRTGSVAGLVLPASSTAGSRSTAWATVLGLPGLLALMFSGRRQRFRGLMRTFGLLLLVSTVLQTLTGCASSTNTATTSTPSGASTPAGSYTVQVVTNGPSGLTPTSNINVTVQ